MRKAKNLTSRQYDELELPLTLGRDFSGVIVSKGHGIGNKLKLGDEIWGVVPVEQQGCHANYVVVNSSHVSNVNWLNEQKKKKKKKKCINQKVIYL